MLLAAGFAWGSVVWPLAILMMVVAGLYVLKETIGIQYVPNDRVGVVEKLWGGSIEEGRIIALNNEAGFQADVKRGGLYFGLPRWKYRIHRVPLVSIPQGKIGYIYARDGSPLSPNQTLGRVVDCNNFQSSREFMGEDVVEGEKKIVTQFAGQRGRQRAFLREGVYAINLALFTVVAEDHVYSMAIDRGELLMLTGWQKELSSVKGFDPVVIGMEDDIGIVTVQDGPPLATGEIIAPEAKGHSNYQDPERFLGAGGQRGRQYAPLTDGTYFINRWFATVERLPKTVIEIGYVGVVISYFGEKGSDVSGDSFRHGERVAQGQKGVWADPLSPGKYAFNTYAGKIVIVPTTNFVLHWVNGKSESHRYDESLKSISLVTRDAYEPDLPLSLVVHIDYKRAPGVVQRFGDVKKLITQTIDPMLSAYFRDCAQGTTMLELLHKRDEIQREAQKTLKLRFQEFDIECVDVLIGKPETGASGGQIETLLDQLRLRQLSRKQVETYEQQRVAADKLRTLTEAQAVANKQAELTNSQVQINIVKNQANAKLAEAEMRKQQTIVESEAQLEQSRRQAEQKIVTANADGEQVVIAAKAKGEQEVLLGKGEGQRVLQVGLSEAISLQRKIAAYGDPRFYALIQAAASISQSAQPLVPERVFSQAGGTPAGDGSSPTPFGGNAFDTLLNLLLANSTAFSGVAQRDDNPQIKELTDKLIGGAIGILNSGSDGPSTRKATEGNGHVTSAN